MTLPSVVRLAAVRGFGVVLTFSISVVVSRAFGPEGFGEYSLFVSLCSGLVMFSKFGADNLLTKNASAASARGTKDEISGNWILGLLLASAASVLVLGLFAASSWACFRTNHNCIIGEQAAQLAAIVLLPAVLLGVNLGLMRGLGNVAAASALELILTPLAIIALILLVGLAPEVAYVTSTVGVSALTILVVILKIDWTKVPKVPLLSSFVVQGWHIVGVSILDFALSWSPSYLLAIWGTTSDVGIFVACWRVVIAINMVMLILDQTNAPKFAALYAAGNLVELERVARLTSSFGMLLSVVAIAAVSVGADFVLGLLGESFTAGGSAMLILCAGHAVSLSCGSSGYLLLMTGNGRKLRSIGFVVLVVQISVSPWLIKSLGVDGAALMSALAVAMNKLAAAILSQRLLSIRVFPSIGIAMQILRFRTNRESKL